MYKIDIATWSHDAYFGDSDVLIAFDDFVVYQGEIFYPKRPVIILPGLTGSRLDNNPCEGSDFEVWPDAFTLLTSRYDEHLQHLMLADNGTDPSDECDDIYVNRSTDIENIENGVIRDVASFKFYGPLIDYLKDQDFPVYPFGYDWRLDLKDTANNLDTFIDQVIATTGANKVDIVDHSLGGLLARYYVTSIGANKVGQVISLGTPFLGAPKSLLALRWGSSGFWDSDLIGIGPVYPPRVEEISQNAPAFYQILPTARYFDVNGGGYFRVDGQLKDLNQTRFLINTDHNADLAIDAENFHSNAMDDWGNYPLDVNFTLILGSGELNTPGELHEHTIINWQGFEFVIRDIIYTDGDGTVPTISASLQGNGEDYSGNADIILYKDISHSQLITDNTIVALIADLLAFSQNNSVAGMTIPLSELTTSYGVSNEPFGINGASIAVWGDINIHIYDDQGNHTGPVGNGGVELGIPDSSYDDIEDVVFVTIGGEGNYTVHVEQVSGDYFDLKIRDIQSSLIQRTISYSNVPVNEGGKGSFSYAPGTVEPAPILALDTNNDGITDEFVSPTGDVGLEGNNDFTVPEINVELEGQTGPYGWYVGDVVVTITASDDQTGVSKIEYSTDRGLSVIEYTDEFTVPADQVSLLVIQATDNAGNKNGISTNIGPQKIYVPIIARND
jgi:pimeloyl-ACP methyl ester carboxylesterase